MKPLLALSAVAAFVLLSGSAFADCPKDTSVAGVKTCLAQDLRDSDDHINATYRLLMSSKDDAGKIALRNEQRAWLKQRDAMCQLNNKESDREKWLQAILADDEKTLCVVRYTFARVTALNDQLPKTAAMPALPNAPQAPRIVSNGSVQAAPRDMLFTDEGYQVDSGDKHEKGKWYFEVRFDTDQLAKLGDFLFETGYHADDGHGMLKEIPIRHREIGGAPLVVGFGVDLDNGGSYARIDGNWNQAPGTNTGIPTKLGTPYHMWLAGSSPLAPLIQQGLIQINLGGRPFVYSLPDGYRPFTAH